MRTTNDQRKALYVPVRMPKDLLTLIDARCKEEGKRAGRKIPRSEIVRRCCEHALTDQGYGDGGTENSRALLDELALLRSDLGRIGGNLNQIAHYFNMIGDVRRDRLAQVHDDLRLEFARLSRKLKEFIDALG